MQNFIHTNLEVSVRPGFLYVLCDEESWDFCEILKSPAIRFAYLDKNKKEVFEFIILPN